MDPRNLVVILSVLVLSDLIVGDVKYPENSLTDQLVKGLKCSGTCLEVVKPVLSHFRELKMAAENSYEYKTEIIKLQNKVEIKDQLINTLNATIQIKNNQMQILNDLFKSKDDQKETINALIRSNEALTKAKSESEELISFKNNVINIKDNLIISLKKQIEEKHEELQKHRKDKDEDKKKLQSCLENVIKNKRTLIEKDQEIQETTDQNSLMTSRINDLSQNLTKANKRLFEFNEQVNACTTAEKGIHNIKLPGVSAFAAPCNGYGWTVIQRRIDGSVDFNRSWNEYRDGFGYLTGEFFIGLEKLYQITQSSQYELLISLGKVDGSRDFVKYDNFKIGSEENSYRLESVGNPTLGGPDVSLKHHLNMKFTTYDRDNDLAQYNCAQICGGGWWFDKCGYSSLNGRFYKDGKMKDNIYGIFWGSWQSYDYSVSLTFAEMMIRPKPL